MNTQFVSVRDMQRDYKKIKIQVDKTNVPAVVMRNQEPQFVIISLDLFNQVGQVMPKSTAKNLLGVINEVEKLNIQAPKDLSSNLDKYAWE